VTDFVNEDQCALCSGMWASEREAFRVNLDKIPLKEPVCNACVMAFFVTLGFRSVTMRNPSTKGDPPKDVSPYFAVS